MLSSDFIKNVTDYHSLKYTHYISDKQRKLTQKVLLQYGAKPDIENFDLDLYLRAGGDPNANGLFIKTLKETIDSKEIEMLLSAGADPEAVDKDGKSALEIAKENPILYCRVYKIKYIEQAIKQKREKQIRDLRERMQKSSDKEDKCEKSTYTTSYPTKDFTPDM